MKTQTLTFTKSLGHLRSIFTNLSDSFLQNQSEITNHFTSRHQSWHWVTMVSSGKLILFTLLIVVNIFVQTSAYSYIKLAPEYKGQCKDENGNARKVGEYWQYEKRCEMATCSQLDGKLYEEVVGCVVMSAQRGCKLFPRLGSSYPSCCPVFRCGFWNGTRWKYCGNSFTSATCK